MTRADREVPAGHPVDPASRVVLGPDEIARAQANYDSPIVTRVEPASAWHPAEDIHQDFYARRRSNGYCRVVIDPKLAKVRRNYSAWLVDA